MEKLFLLDAYALIYRAYYAFIRTPRINSQGKNTSAIFGFVNTLEEVLRREQPNYIGACFDPPGGTFRNELYPQYKAQREETPEDIRFSIPYIKEIVKAYNIPIIEIPNYEADDVIGTLAYQASEEGLLTYMMTLDKDYGQLVSPLRLIYKPGKGEVVGVKEINEKYGFVRPSQVIDFLGLMGDVSDNIPGCRGVGEKTAIKLIQEFDSIDNLLAHTDQLKGALKEKIETQQEQIRLSKLLATIKTDVPIVLDRQELRVKPRNSVEIERLFTELEFRTLLSKQEKPKVQQPTLFDSVRPAPSLFPEAETAPAVVPDHKRYHLMDTPEQVAEVVQVVLRAGIVSIDMETIAVNSLQAQLVGVSFAIKPDEAYYIPLSATDTASLEALRAIYESHQVMKVGQNLKYAMLVLANYGITLQGKLFDTTIAHYLLQPEQPHSLDRLAEHYLNYHTVHSEDLFAVKGKKEKSMADLSPAESYQYACEDADVALQLYHIFAPQLHAAGLEPLFDEIEMPLVPVLIEMERNGIRLDTATLAETASEFQARLGKVEAEIYSRAGTSFNLASPKQVGDLLFDRLMLVEKPKKTKKGQYITSEEVLEGLKHKHDIVAKILEHRGLKKLLGTYIEALPKLINPQTGHIHTSFNQTVTATGRLSSSNPNLQNIPIKSEDGKEIRKAFVPEEGCLFFSADYSQVELRLMAHISEDPQMIADFSGGKDIHTATAARILHKDLADVTREERNRAKAANFGIIYGISAFGLSQQTGLSRSEAAALIESYFQTYPAVKQYMDNAIAEAKAKGYATTLFGRRRYLPDIQSANAVVRGYAERNAINAPIQGSAADIIKRAMVCIYRRFQEAGLRSKMLLQVHDELCFSVLRDEKERVEQIVIREMEQAIQLHVPLQADGGWGVNWLTAH